MSEIIGALNDESDPDGTVAALAERIAAERAWVRALRASRRRAAQSARLASSHRDANSLRRQRAALQGRRLRLR
jgi:hypothetical protein